MIELDWTRWPNFRASEFDCQCGTCGGENKMDADFLDKLQAVRTAVGFGMTITSGYRCANHPIEKKKPGGPGAHNSGAAADIRCSGQQAFQLIEAGLKLGMWGIGVSQRKGQPRFVHLDRYVNPARPNVWSY